MKKSNKGNAILTTPIIIAIGMAIVSTLIVLTVKIMMPYIWYEKLSSACIKYIFVMEEYGYLTKKEANSLKDELKRQGFDEDNLNIYYTSSRVDYGNPIYIRLNYDYELELPIIGNKKIPMVIERNSVSKR